VKEEEGYLVGFVRISRFSPNLEERGLNLELRTLEG
jgi:hypothetical protein